MTTDDRFHAEVHDLLGQLEVLDDENLAACQVWMSTSVGVLAGGLGPSHVTVANATKATEMHTDPRRAYRRSTPNNRRRSIDSVRALLLGALAERATGTVATTTIFIASSEYLHAERNAIEVRLKDDRLYPEWRFDVRRSENHPHDFVDVGSQHRYDESIRSADVIVFVVADDVGEFLEAEFDVARAAMEATGHPLILLFFQHLDGPDRQPSRRAFEQRLRELGHYFSTYRTMIEIAGSRVRRVAS